MLMRFLVSVEMPPNISGTTACIDKETSAKDENSLLLSEKITPKENGNFEATKSNGFVVEKKKESTTYFEQELKWINIISIFILHALAAFALITFPYSQKHLTKLHTYLVGQLVGFGVTGGAHRLWTHRAYKAKWPLRVILLYSYYTSGQNSLFDWVRDHRVHHKYSETEADPHDSTRGFFFSHVGWLMMKKHPEVIRRGRQVDMSDVTSDPIVAFGEKHFVLFKILCCFIIPTIIPVYLWNEEWYYAIFSQIARYAISLNFTWSVNSAAHIWGSKPYDKTIAPAENRFVAYVAMGEGWHNYHHVFPYDYKAAELGNYSLNYTTFLIDMFSKIGWAYDLKQPSKELIKAVREKRGHNHSHKTELSEEKSY
ncbi:acyl-CoA Delta-9 desaturase isoform X2 [Leptopilina heterotoma]|uniref:acyl-CoA Delta-9 desaturase isoform X2 n=1 Tax=Leptopilina heterotoma TaxID=63436 RepID=UPI001CA80C19|nr:acyl-CoA Delta-9 desaturase isoform X2 [Leptopilina heterotoma]